MYKQQIIVKTDYNSKKVKHDIDYVFLTEKWGKIKFLLTREIKQLDFDECITYSLDLDTYLVFLNKQEFKTMCNPYKVIVEINKLKRYMKRNFQKEIAISKAKLLKI